VRKKAQKKEDEEDEGRNSVTPQSKEKGSGNFLESS
jgi:hypothetical protein